MTAEPDYREEEVRVFQERAFHSSCGGEFVSTGNGASNMLGTQWEHRCDKCGHRAMIHAPAYPRIIYKPAQ